MVPVTTKPYLHSVVISMQGIPAFFYSSQRKFISILLPEKQE